MTTIGDVAVKLGLDSKDFIKQIDKAEDECKKLEHNLNETKESFEKMSKAMAMTKNPSKEMVNAFKNLKNELRNQQSAFNDFQGKLNKFDGGLIQGKNSVNLLQGALGKLVAGGAIIALGKQMIDFSKQSVEAYRVQDRAIKGLNNALQNAGVYTAKYSNHLQKLSKEIQSFSNYGDEAVEKAIGLGQAFSGNIKLTDDLIKATVDYAAATETDLQTAFTLVGKSIGTSTNALARYGVSLDQNMSKEEKMAVITQTLQQRFNGSAKSMADASVQLKNATGDLSEAFGKALNPAVVKTQNILIESAKTLTNWINKVRAMHAEINSLSKDELNTRLIDVDKRINRFKDQKTYATFGANSAQFKALIKERQDIINQMSKLDKKEVELANASRNSKFGTSTITKNENIAGSSKETKQDKALEAYKKYIEEYAKLNDDYAATLKARQYVEGTLNIDPIAQQDEYNKTIAIYQNYYSKLAEITRSGAKNKAEIEKLAEEKLAQDLQELRLSKEQETQSKIQEIIKGYKDTETNINIANVGTTNSFLGGLSSEYKAKLDLEIWYQQERNRIIEESNGNLQLQTDAFAQLDTLKTAKLAQANLSTWEDYGRSVSSIMSNVYTNLITGQESFADAMKNMAQNMLLQLLQMLAQYVIKEMAIRAASMFLGGGIGGVLTGITSAILPKHHSGGMILGTKEQVAVLQGGERVLNRSEAASYNSDDASGDGGINNIMVFNIKAWDGRDVIDTLKANEQTINQIVSSGIKNNKQGLRTVVQNT